MSATNPDSELAERRRQALGPTYQNFFERPLHLVRGEGVRLWDAAGNEYLDCYNNVVSVGHCHPRVVDALCRQAATLNTHTRYLHPSVVELGEKLVARLPAAIDTCVFTCTGSEANDFAIQVAREVTGNLGVVVSEASYHGTTELTRRLSTDSYPAARRPDWLAVIEPPNRYRGPAGYDDPGAGERLAALARDALDALDARGHRPAALLIDPVWDSNGPLVAPDGYVVALADEVRRRGGLIVVDEVQAGYCRTGAAWWGCANYGLAPDILTCGKPMGAGHPLALAAMRRDIAEAYAERFHYFNTFGGNPVSAEVGKAVIDVIDDEGLLDNARATGAYFESRLRDLATRHAVIGDVQGSGLFWGLDLVTDAAAKTPVTRARMRRLCSLIAANGVVIGHSGRYGQILKLRPPLVFSPADVDRAVAAIDAALGQFGAEDDD